MNAERKALEQLIGSGSLVAGEPCTTEYHGLRALMLAVLEDAIEQYRGTSTAAQAEAEHWIHTGSNRSPFSFHTVCEVLGLAPDATRRLSLAKILSAQFPALNRHLVGRPYESELAIGERSVHGCRSRKFRT